MTVTGVDMNRDGSLEVLQQLQIGIAHKVFAALLQYGALVSKTPQMTCFRGAKVCRIWLQEKVTIKLYSLTTS